MTAEEFARVVSQTTMSTPSSMDENGTGDGKNGIDYSQSLNTPSFLTKNEQIAIFMNLAIPGIISIPKCLSQETTPRCAPPEYFTVRRYKPVTYATTTTLAHVTSSTAAGAAGNKPVKSVCSKFLVNNSDLFIVGASIPIRLDPGYYSVRTPKLDCQLKFTSKLNLPDGQMVTGRGGTDEHQIILDTIDESISFVISKDKDCHVKLKKPLHVKKGNINELLLTFQSTALTDDIVVIKGHRNKTPQMEIVDGEAISWTFLKTTTVEFNELYYYY
ncbi:hypothetical protein BLA29_005354 [Euroglyphus maynei]|uniref:Uncharacterized protein n=1 Tax=Euroglyphus maynei TaxID=6958 RepID=A0A1Y3BMF5_EURMA|nr:hypothetical protein BLA29_005354 [Euroglyphus maynei]